MGLSGKDAGLILAKKLRMVHRESVDMPPEIIDPGHVGEVIRINPSLIETLAEKGFIPIVAPVGEGAHGESYNINADAVASHMAMALSAMKLIFNRRGRGEGQQRKADEYHFSRRHCGAHQ